MMLNTECGKRRDLKRKKETKQTKTRDKRNKRKQENKKRSTTAKDGGGREVVHFGHLNNFILLDPEL